MNKIIIYCSLLLLIILYIICLNDNYFEQIDEIKYKSKSILGFNKYENGDLYGMSYLPMQKEKFDTAILEVPIEQFPIQKKINLCLVHDSYLSKHFLKSKTQLPMVDTIYNIEYPWRVKNFPKIDLDSSKNNVLIFELVERHLLTFFDSLTAFTVVPLTEPPKKAEPAPTAVNATLLEKITSNLFNKETNNHLQSIVFDSRIFAPFKELKAYINYRFLKRTVPEVYVSNNEEYLFFDETKPSVSKYISDEEINKTVNLLNKISEFYKNKGFCDVYFSILPNPVSIISPDSDRYNQLIPLVQQNPKLKMPMIDVFDIFKKSKQTLFCHSDSHWNKNGCQLWLNECNRKLYTSKNYH